MLLRVDPHCSYTEAGAKLFIVDYHWENMMKIRFHELIRNTGVALMLVLGTGSQAAEFKVMSTNGVKAVLEELAPQFEKTTGHKLAIRFAPAADLKGLIEKGEAERGFSQISELMGIEGAELAGPFPPGFEVQTVFPAAVGTGAREPAAAQALIRFLSAPAAAPVIKARGMEPG